jgi:hypothetical protein
MKYVVIEDMISKEIDVEELDKWTDQLQQSVDSFNVMVVGIKQSLNEIDKTNIIATAKQLTSTTKEDSR